MPLQSIKHKLSRIFELGPRQSLRIAKNKICSKIFELRWRRRALSGRTECSWANKNIIPASFKYAAEPPSTSSGVNAIANFILNKVMDSGRTGKEDFSHTKKYTSAHENIFPPFVLRGVPFGTNLKDQEKILTQADLYTQNIFDILGSGPQKFTHLPWHEDFKLKSQNSSADYIFDSTSFYKDIKIKVGKTDDLLKDIKTPWELSRFQHLVILGQAYEITHDEKYAQTFVEHITDWLTKNPYMLGINWASPMEVGVRAINWIWAWHYFKNSGLITLEFWRKFTCSLDDHMHYLENNWETYDGRTSNHYLADLIGYFYLCWFFEGTPSIIKKRNWCYQEMLREFDKQIFNEGTSYEGSTAYHTLVTQMFDHFVFLCEEFNLPLSDDFKAKHKRMHEFIWWCTINDNEMIKIGDDDSGKLVFFSWQSQEKKCIEGIKSYPLFGLSIFKNEKLHLTLRHHAYHKRQSSGHMHNDALSITLAAHGTPIIIDPGSYTYTPSKIWRNHFRSVAVHNTFYVTNQEPVLFDERLFALNIPAASAEVLYEGWKNKITLADTQNIVSASHNLYSRFGLEAHRTVCVENNTITITDWWSSKEKTFNDKQSSYNFTLHPEITAKKEDEHWVFYHNDKSIARMKSNLEFTLHDTWVSLGYGNKAASHCLRAQAPIELDKKIETMYEFIYSNHV